MHFSDSHPLPLSRVTLLSKSFLRLLNQKGWVQERPTSKVYHQKSELDRLGNKVFGRSDVIKGKTAYNSENPCPGKSWMKERKNRGLGEKRKRFAAPTVSPKEATAIKAEA